MAVVEKDEVIQGLLKEELQRCRAALTALESKLSAFPKGAYRAMGYVVTDTGAQESKGAGTHHA
jgi:hypothetical protein